MHTLYKPNGATIQVNNSSLKHALSLGWKAKPAKKPAKKAE